MVKDDEIVVTGVKVVVDSEELEDVTIGTLLLDRLVLVLF